METRCSDLEADKLSLQSEKTRLKDIVDQQEKTLKFQYAKFKEQ